LEVEDIHLRRGVPHRRVLGKSSKTRFLPLHAGAQDLLNDSRPDRFRHLGPRKVLAAILACIVPQYATALAA